MSASGAVGGAESGADGGEAEGGERRNPQRVVITEVYFHVPQLEDVSGGVAGGGASDEEAALAAVDASGDGRRSATGDEFIELWNPTGEAIDLEGWSIVSRLAWGAEDASAKKGVRFVFPSFELPAGETVVVFNGYRTRVPGRVGSERRSPRERNGVVAGAVGGCWVFRMSMGSRNRAWSNSGDFALLVDPSGEPVEGVVWGDPEPGPPASEGEDDRGEWVVRYDLHRVGKDPGGSVQRDLDGDGLLRRFVAHARLRGGVRGGGGGVCSPGVVPELPRGEDDDDGESGSAGGGG